MPSESKNKGRILIVDDEPDIIMMVRMFLEHHGFTILEAHDGQEGLTKAKEEEPDLIILDLMLPSINGYKVCGLLKNDKRFAQIPVILYSAKSQEQDNSLIEQAGADAYISKTLDSDKLLEKIEELLAGAAVA